MLTVTYADSSMERSTYSGNIVTHQDASGASSQQTVDALGRVTNVVEDPGTPVCSNAQLQPCHFNYNTGYSYDALDDLIGVTQSGLLTVTCGNLAPQARCFTYD